jgi:hypothetical protein
LLFAFGCRAIDVLLRPVGTVARHFKRLALVGVAVVVSAVVYSVSESLTPLI